MKCYVCENGDMRPTVRDVPHTYKGFETTIKNVQGYGCPACDEFAMSPEEAQRVSTEMLNFNTRINAEKGQGTFIAGVRKKLGLDQKAASQIFGGGINAFSRYETGKTEAAPSLIMLLRLLDNHPDLLKEIQDGSGEAPVISRRREARSRA